MRYLQRVKVVSGYFRCCEKLKGKTGIIKGQKTLGGKRFFAVEMDQNELGLHCCGGIIESHRGHFFIEKDLEKI